MKKNLLTIALVLAAMTANAQESSCVDLSALGVTETGVDLAAGLSIGSTTNVAATIGADNKYKSVGVNGPKDANNNSYVNITFDGTTISGGDLAGIQGNDNPKDASGSTPCISLGVPTTGAFLNFKIAEGTGASNTLVGYLYVAAKMSSNKAYTVFEDGTPIGYDLSLGGDGTKLPSVINVSVENNYTDGDGIGSVTTDNAYYNTTSKSGGIEFVEQIAKGMTRNDDLGEWEVLGNSGIGYISFPVYGGLNYAVNANGSKIIYLGYYLSPTEAKNISISTNATAEVTASSLDLVKNGVPTAISSVTASGTTTSNAALYNLAGQKVNKDYKGVVVCNGKKYIK